MPISRDYRRLDKLYCTHKRYGMVSPMSEIEIVRERERAEVLLHPLRLRIMESAREPASAAELARRLSQKPQNVNYHVGRLSEHGFLRKTEERRAGNIVEGVYGASARNYVLASGVLGNLSPDGIPPDVSTAGRLLGLQARAERELGVVLQEAEAGTALGALSLEAEFRFESAEQRSIFARAVREVFDAVVRKYASPTSIDGVPADGRPYRMILGCYPVPEPSRSSATEFPSLRTPGSRD